VIRAKKWMALALAWMLLLHGVALASVVVEDLYSDAPANPTQDNVDYIVSEYCLEGVEKSPCSIVTLVPSPLTVDVLEEIYDFVDVNRQPPARYFPEETQQEIKEILGGGDPDALYMPEFMSILPEKMQLDADVLVDVQMNIDYNEGQLVIPVLGREAENGVEWKALPSTVVEKDIIRFTVPCEIMRHYAGQETLFALLALKPGSGNNEADIVTRVEESFIPSKNASNIVYVIETITYTVDGELVDCQIIIVPQTAPIKAEMNKMMLYFTNALMKPIRYFDEVTIHEAALMLNDVDVDTLIPYEVTQVMVRNYQEPYGDVMAKFSFPTPFEEGQQMVALIGMPDNEGAFSWMPLHAEVKDEYVEITFSSSVLPAMMEDAGILLVMGEHFTK